MSGDAMSGVRDALAHKRKQIVDRQAVNADLKLLLLRHRATAQAFCEKLAACDDELERFELEDELLSHQAQFLTEQEDIVRRAESAGVCGALTAASFCQLVPLGAPCALVVPMAAPPAQPSVALADAPKAGAVLPPPSDSPSAAPVRAPPSARRPFIRFTTLHVPASVSDSSAEDAPGVLPEYNEDEPKAGSASALRVSARPKRMVSRKRRIAESDDEDDAETLVSDDQTNDDERREESSDSFVAHSDSDGANSESEWGDSSASELSAAKESEQKSDEQQKSGADQVAARPTRLRVQSAVMSLRDARCCALAGNWAPLEAYYDSKMNSSAVHCGAPLDAKRKKQYEELVTAAKGAQLTCSALEWPDFVLCRMCNTHKLCRYSIESAGQNIGSAGGHCAKRLGYIITASGAVADARLQLAAAPKETHESLLRQLTEKVETAYTVLLDHQ
jgi:hypothetical protein